MDPSPSLLHVLVVDDHDVVRLGLRHLLAGLDRACDIAEACDLRAALAHVDSRTVDLLLLDLALGEEFALSSIARLRKAQPPMRILVLSSMDEDLYAERCLRAGADGYLMKSALRETLVEAVRATLAGEVYVSPRLRTALLRRVARGEEPGAPLPLSPREVEVLRLVAAGRGTREIATQLNRSVKTIETHKQALKTKLGADSPGMLVRKAMAWLGEAS